ncbi:uncharacterized protein LOC115887675 [Sitophilus oryzae]|uniref:Uncharacterized protein LOC115887675 n=1 Tax=Sitophilus oryzae TaxID=7048 RepID=A0A6J2YJE7_SITOR|nr:uncharacterized protein LOC115887675 [Sitophilus oryzae]
MSTEETDRDTGALGGYVTPDTGRCEVLDSGLRMTTHVRRIVEKAIRAINTLSRVMPNVGGPRAMKRRTMASAVTSIILYAAPIWRRAIQYQHYQNMLQSMIRRLALRITSAYRTAPTTAILALAVVMPISR